LNGAACHGTLALVGDVVQQLAVGAVLGFLLGYASRWVIARLSLPATGLYPAFTVGVAALSFGLPTLAHGSGFLGVYVAGVTSAGERSPSIAKFVPCTTRSDG
jgi:cell volume regulation protein A